MWTVSSNDVRMQNRISVDLRIMGGVPCISGTRVPVATIVGLLGQGYRIEEVLTEYPTLTRQDVLAALRFAALAVGQRGFPQRPGTQPGGG